MEDREDWIASELAQEGNVTQRWIGELCATGVLEGARKRAGAWFIPYEVGQRWLEERQSKKAASPSEEEETAS